VVPYMAYTQHSAQSRAIEHAEKFTIEFIDWDHTQLSANGRSCEHRVLTLLPPLPLSWTVSRLPATCFKGRACQAKVRMDSDRAAAASRELRAKHSPWKPPARLPSSSGTGFALEPPALASARAQSAASFARSPISLCRPARAARSNCRTAHREHVGAYGLFGARGQGAGRAEPVCGVRRAQARAGTRTSSWLSKPEWHA